MKYFHYLPALLAASGMSLMCVALRGQPSNIGFTTFAGLLSSGSEGGEARFFHPQGLAVDSAGNIYVADTNNHVIRKVTADGVVSTLAGLTGQSGTSDGIGQVARFNRPTNLAIDRTGDIVVADTGNHTIRRVSASGVVTTIAGLASQSGSTDDLADAARFDAPAGIAIDAAGNIYVCDSNNHTIRKITAGGLVTTLAGSAGKPGTLDATAGAARFNFPLGVAVDGAGNLYVADTSNHAVRKITSAGQVTTLAGTPGLFGSTDGMGQAARFYGPVGVAIDSKGNLFVSDTGDQTIRMITPAGAVTTLAGRAGQIGGINNAGDAARFNSPQGLAIGLAGNLYVADAGNHAIRKVTLEGIVSTLAGAIGKAGGADGSGGLPRFQNPHAVAVDSAGNLYVADTDGHTIRKVNSAGVVTTLAGSAGLAGATDGTGGGARFNSPGGIAVDSGGVVYVADTGNNAVRRVSPTGIVTTLAGAANRPGREDGAGAVAQFTAPQGIAVDPLGNIFVADTFNHTIRKIAPSGIVTTVAGAAGQSGTTDGPGEAARFFFPTSVAIDSAGNLYIGDSGNITIRVLNVAGVVSTLADSAKLFGKPKTSIFSILGSSVLGVAVDATGNVLVAGTYDHTIRILSRGVSTILAGSSGEAGSGDGTGAGALFNSPVGVAVDSGGVAFVADTANSTLRKVTPNGVTTTVAGTPGLLSSADQSGSAARFNFPQGVVADAAKNIYVTDTGNNTIRKIAPNGSVTTIAGFPGVKGFKDGVGNAAQFSRPTGIAIDSLGNLFVSDTGNDAIRKVTPGGVVSTLAGAGPGNFGSNDGIGTVARFDTPVGIAVDSSGNVYVGDSGNHTIRRITPAGLVSTFVGAVGIIGGQDGTGTSARFAAPSGLAIDSAGILYVGDAVYHTIRRVNPAGVVTTLAGSAQKLGGDDGTGNAASFNGPSGISVDRSGNLYVADLGNSTIRKISPSGLVSTLAGSPLLTGATDGTGTAARFGSPSGVAVDSSGNVYVADTDNHTIRQVTPNGVATTLAGTPGSYGNTDGTIGAVRYNFPSAVAVDAIGNIYVADRDNHTIRKITANGVSTLAGVEGQPGSADGQGSAARFSGPAGIAVDGLGNIYVADTGNHVIRKISTGGVVTTLSGSPGQSGAADGTGSSARFNFPNGIAIDVSGRIFVADFANHSVRRIEANGAVTTLAGSLVGNAGDTDGIGTAARFNAPTSVCVDSAGNVFVADFANQAIRRISITGAVTTIAGAAGFSGQIDGIAGAARFNYPSGIAADAGGNLFVADSRNHTVRKISASGLVTTVAGAAVQLGSNDGTGGAARFNTPLSLAVDTLGNVVVADTSNNTIRKVTSGGVVTTLSGTAPGSGDGANNQSRFLFPNGVAANSAGTIYVADTFNQTIRVISADGVKTLAGAVEQAGSTDGIGAAARFNFPASVTVDSSGFIFVADRGNHTIRRISAAGVVTTFAGTAGVVGSADGTGAAARFSSPQGLAADSLGNIYVADTGNHIVRKITSAGVVTTLAGAAGIPGNADGTSARFRAPSGVAVDATGTLWIADRDNHSIRKISAAGVVTTVAGAAGIAGSLNGTGTAARFFSPTGIGLDSNGNLFVADRDNHVIRRVTAAGVVTTLAGIAAVTGSADGVGAAASFRSPTGICLDIADNIYVADTYNHTIRRGANLARIQITGLDAGQSLPVGSALTAGVTGVSAPLSYTWLKNGVPIPGATQSTLTVPNLQPSDAGTYSVVVGTIEGNVSVSAVQVTVSQPPAITTPPQSQSVAVGQSLSFSVTASGTNPTYQWQQNGTAISGATNATYVISNAQMSDAGTYRVIVSAAGVSVESTAAVLTVLAAAPVTRIANVSILTALTSSTDEFTLGYVVGNASGANPLPLVIRAAGPALGAVGVGGTLADPRLQLFAGSTATSDNDNWGGTAVLRNAFASVGAFAFASDTSKDAAALAGITTRDNSVKVSAADGGTGQVIAEIYDATPAAIISASGPRLVNISVLKQIGSGLTVGFVISGTSAKNILIRALGPALSIVAPISAASVIADPRLELFDGKSASIGVNDNWGGTAALRAAFFSAGTFDLVSNSLDAALIGSLSPGSYTVQVKPSTGSSGLGLVEVYELP